MAVERALSPCPLCGCTDIERSSSAQLNYGVSNVGRECMYLGVDIKCRGCVFKLENGAYMTAADMTLDIWQEIEDKLIKFWNSKKKKDDNKWRNQGLKAREATSVRKKLAELGYDELTEEQKEANLNYNLTALELDKLGD